jgi:hypothetical protein
MMYATYCSALRDDKTITESEKAKKVKEYNNEIRKAFSALPSTNPDKETIGEKKSRPNGAKSIRGSTAISRHTRTGLDKLVRTLGIQKFDLSLDDPLLDDYYLITLRIQNGDTAVEQPLTFAIFTGVEHSKILNIQQRVLRPRNKAVKMKHSIPQAQWTWPESGVKSKFTWDYVSIGEERMGFNIYRSLLRDSGYGRVNSTLIDSTNWEMVEKARSELFPAYYKLSAVSELWGESDLGEPVEVQNLAPFTSFVRKEALGKEAIRAASSNQTTNPLDESERRFAQGRVDITFINGLDSGADLKVYLLCKIPPGSELAPSVMLDGSPSVRFELRDKASPIRSSAVQFQPDKLRAALTPIAVTYYSSSESIYLTWKKPKGKEFEGVRIFRTPERQLGNLQELSQEQEIYDGAGINESISLTPLKNEGVVFPRPSPRSEGALRLRGPTPRPKPVPSSPPADSTEQGPLKPPDPPKNLRIVLELNLDADYYIDNRSERKTFTYVVYGYDRDGNLSYPVFVNASMTEPNVKQER